MTDETTDDPFDECELAPDAILGTHTFEDVLFTDDTEISVNVLSGETPAHSQATVEEATKFAASTDTDTPQIALPASVETQIETQSKPYTAAAFFQFKVTGSLELHRAYHAAYEADAFSVDFEADYESGDLMIPVFAVGSSLVSAGVESGSIGALAAPLAAVAVPWLAGALFAMNPLGDEGAVLPVTLTAVSGRQYVRGLMTPGLVFGLPLVLVATVIAGLLSPYTLVEQLGLVALGLYLTAVAVTITPAIGMALPRFSAVSVGQSRNVLPPRMSAVAVHAAVTVLPGALLAALLLVPSAARAVLAGVFGFLPAFLLELIAGSDGGVLTGVTEWFAGFGSGIQAVGLTQLRSVAGGALLFGGVLVSILLYRNAIHRFGRYAPW